MSDDIAVLQLHRAAAAMRQQVEQLLLRRGDLSWTGFVVLHTVWRREPVETRSVSAETGIAKGTLSGVVDVLAERGLLQRQPHPADGRLVLLVGTPTGRNLAKRLVTAIRAEEAFVFRGWSERQVERFNLTLQQVTDRLETDEARARRR
jgi:DNA-binding MarR family transcriptional regulator